MNSLARNALRFSMAGAGIAVLGAGVAGQASAAELPELPELPGGSAVTDSLPTPDEDGGFTSEDGSVSFGAIQAPELGAGDLPELPELPSADGLPGLDSLAPAGDALPTGEQQAADDEESGATEDSESDDAESADSGSDETASDDAESDDAASDETGSDSEDAGSEDAEEAGSPLDMLPSAEDLPAPGAEALPVLEIPDVMYLEAPTVS